MNQEEIVEIANETAIQRFLVRCFSDCARYATHEYVGATITIEPSRHRTGIPADAVCKRFIITNLAEGWSIVVRTVWRDGRLHTPAATHTRIEHYFDNDGRYVAKSGVCGAVNRWLGTLPL